LDGRGPSSTWSSADTHTLASPVDFTAHCHRCCAGARKGRHRSPLVSRPTRWSVRSPQTPSLPACPAMFRNTARRSAVTSRAREAQTVTPPPLREPRNRCAGLVVLVQKGASRAERWAGPCPPLLGAKGADDTGWGYGETMGGGAHVGTSGRRQRAGYSGAGRRPWRNLENRGLPRHGRSQSQLLDGTVG